jgi:glycosyltransferase involved in cell wall biosynthesis
MGDGAERLRVLLVAPPWYEVPPRGYGGIEVVISDLAKALAGQGHEVFLVVAGPKKITHPGITVIQTRPDAPGWDPAGTETERRHNDAVLEIVRSLRVDLVHDHWMRREEYTHDYGLPTVLTITCPMEQQWVAYKPYLSPRVHPVAISEEHRRLLHREGVECSYVAYNGLDESTFPFRTTKKDYVLYLGRFSSYKGAHLAARAALEANIPIRLAGRIQEESEEQYFAAEVDPLVDGERVVFLGEASSDKKRDLLANARCALTPITWPEPFGMVMTEAMACGTPVVALRQGAAPELIDHGVTGILCDWDPVAAATDRAAAEQRAVEQLARALLDIGMLSPYDCRKRVESLFGLSSMAMANERVYRDVLRSTRPV